jgi:hypothetical protein
MILLTLAPAPNVNMIFLTVTPAPNVNMTRLTVAHTPNVPTSVWRGVTMVSLK